MVGRSLLLFAFAALCEIGGGYLVWIGIKDGRGAWAVVAGGILLVAYGVVAALQSEGEFGRVFAAYGGFFIVASIGWAAAFDGFRPDRFDLLGAAICLVGAGVLFYAPR